ncbi:MAG: phosphoribosylglycinamide formyltransferase [Acidocella sp.]|nr:phosphoribosylglycinamide formyltransferase [Acidocella sp.]
MKPRVAVLCSGRGSNMTALITAARAPDYPAEIALVISDKPAAPALGFAAAEGIAAQAVPAAAFGRDRAAHERAIDAVFVAHGIEVVCLAGYMRILTPYLVGRWAGRMLNIHPSLLPKYPGLDTHARALAAGEAEHGCTVHLVTAVLDDGPILGQASVPVLPGDDEPTLAARVLAQEHILFPATLAAFVRQMHLPESTPTP